MLERRFLLMTVCLFLLAGAVFAQVGNIEGTVLLPMPGGPAVGATVTILRMNSDSLTTTTDSLGHFRFDSVAAGEWGAHANLDPYAPAFGEVHVRPGHTEHFTLFLHNQPTGFGVVQGIVLLPDQGGPAVGATVWLFRARGDSMVTTADDSGRFVFDSARVGLHDLHASLTGYLGAHIRVLVIDAQTVHVTLFLRNIPVPTYGNVEGNVIFAADSLPAAGAIVTLFTEHGHDSLVATTDAAGHFAFELVLTGEYDIRATLTGYLPASRDVNVHEGQTAQVTFRLRIEPTAVVAGLVTLADATPVADAFVWMFVPGNHHRTMRARTDSLGAFTILHVPAGNYAISAAKHSVGFASAQITVTDGQTTNVTLVLSDSAGNGGRATEAPNAANDPNALPVKEFMAKSYPNPFNPTATINFSVPAASLVRLTVYDVLGRKVADLVNGYREAGSYNVSFNGESLPSGIYIYRLTAGNLAHTGRMTLLK